ncbi:MAG: type I secretion system permease/ATPase [Janthinobacterium lividum]
MSAEAATVRRRVWRVLGAGFGLALALTGFVDLAVLVVPIYDMQLYDRVMQSRNMDTLTLLSVFCVVGLVIYFVLDALRSACLIAIGDAVGRRLGPIVLAQGITRAAGGDGLSGTTLVRDLNEVQGFLSSGAVSVPMDALCAPLFLAVLFALHPAFGFLGLAGVAALVLAGIAAEWRIGPAVLAAQVARAAADQALSRDLVEPDVSDGLGMLPAVGRRWARRHGRALAELDRVGVWALALGGVARVLRLALGAGIMALGAVLVIAGVTTPGALMGANLLGGKLLAPFDHLVGSWRHWALAIAAWRRIDAMLLEAARIEASPPQPVLAQPGPARPVPSRPDPDAVPGLAVSGVTLRTAQGLSLLDGIELSVPPGHLVLLAGPNGAGKTTLLRLLAGLVRPDAGQVLLDGAPVRTGGSVGFLPQSVSLLDGTMRENVSRFRENAPPKDAPAENALPEDAVTEAAVAAARLAEVHELIGRMARGYDTVLSNNAAALSGGMRQRVGLARAVFGAPRLLLLDEPDASLDGEGAEALGRTLRACCAAGAIAVVVSHRQALRAAADLVLTLERGRLTASAPDRPAAAAALTRVSA